MILFLFGLTAGVFAGISVMCLMIVGSEARGQLSINRLVEEVQDAEENIQSLKGTNDLGGTTSWWYGRKSLATQLLNEVREDADLQ
jgi:MFS superfamily sulfate permease-like transporter